MSIAREIVEGYQGSCPAQSWYEARYSVDYSNKSVKMSKMHLVIVDANKKCIKHWRYAGPAVCRPAPEEAYFLVWLFEDESLLVYSDSAAAFLVGEGGYTEILSRVSVESELDPDYYLLGRFMKALMVGDKLILSYIGEDCRGHEGGERYICKVEAPDDEIWVCLPAPGLPEMNDEARQKLRAELRKERDNNGRLRE